MRGWDEGTYGARIAGVYDRASGFGGAVADTDGAVETLAVLADEVGTRSLLELGSGTGRLLMPLAARGYEVAGVEISPDMVAEMRQRDDAIPVLVGDMADFDLDRRFGVVFVAFNTLHFLESQKRQLACLRAAARHLEPGGLFVCEAFLPYPLTRNPPRGVTTAQVELDELVLIPYRHDQVEQVVEAAIVTISEDGTRIYPYRTRYVWPPELDLMAQLAGFQLRDRWSDWSRSPFGDGCDSHVSVYRC